MGFLPDSVLFFYWSLLPPPHALIPILPAGGVFIIHNGKIGCALETNYSYQATTGDPISPGKAVLRFPLSSPLHSSPLLTSPLLSSPILSSPILSVSSSLLTLLSSFLHSPHIPSSSLLSSPLLSSILLCAVLFSSPNHCEIVYYYSIIMVVFIWLKRHTSSRVHLYMYTSQLLMVCNELTMYT